MATQAIGYLRVSGKGQVEGDGFDRQAEAIRKYAKANNIEVVETFRDEGVSGKKELADRRGLAAALDRIESNCVRLVLVERADRLARDLLIQETILGQFRGLEVQVIAADSGTDLTVNDDDPTRKLIRQVLGAVSEFDKSVTVLKLRAARDRIRGRSGRCEGRKPFGSKPNEAKTLDRIKQLRRKPRGGERLSYAAIAEKLNAEGLTTRQGRAWHRGSVHAICQRAEGNKAMNTEA